MNAYVAVTDRAWFDFLSTLPNVDEVNFWQPKPWGGAFGVMSRGEPLLFKLKAPVDMIVGGGFFETYTTLPLSLAWQAFGAKNGAASHQAVWDRIIRLRREDVPPWEDPDIGCIVLVEPFFWPKDLWIPQPADWSRNIVRGKTYDLRVEPGRTLWRQVTERLNARSNQSPEPAPGPIIPGGYGPPVPTQHRIGQGTFRVVVTDAYGRECAITRERALPALEAAHIRPFGELQAHSVRNGMLLRSDIHRLFDAGYITVTPEYRVEASRRMKQDFDDGDTYLRLHGTGIILPKRLEEHPDPSLLQWHNENRFRE